jgi:hypothetical protein
VSISDPALAPRWLLREGTKQLDMVLPGTALVLPCISLYISALLIVRSHPASPAVDQ